jgi:hypothetical protein
MHPFLYSFHVITNTHSNLKGGAKLERARDLFEQALEKCPPKNSKPLFLMYAKLEEEYGLAKRSMSIFDRATQAVGDEDKFEVCSSVRNLNMKGFIDAMCFVDVHNLHRQSDIELWSSCHETDL